MVMEVSRRQSNSLSLLLVCLFLLKTLHGICWMTKKRKGEFLLRCCHSELTVCVFFFPYGSITISLIHGYGLAVSASKIMFAYKQLSSNKSHTTSLFPSECIVCFWVAVCSAFWKTTTDFLPKEGGTESTGRCSHNHTSLHAVLHTEREPVVMVGGVTHLVLAFN